MRKRTPLLGREDRRMQKTIDGVRLAYDTAGSGTALVLLHGFSLDRSMWDAQFDALARVCRVIRIDLRGSGESGCGVGPALMETLAGDVFGLLDALGVERAIVAGHSMGGYVALAFFRMYAERVAGLALIASQVGADTPERASWRRALGATVTAHGMTPVVDTVLDGMLAPSFAAAQPALVERIRTVIARHDPVGAAAQIVGMKERLDSADLLADIAVPALIVGGMRDRLIAPALLEQTAAAIADCEYVALPEVGHLPPLEAPAATSAALERLVRRCDLAASADRQSASAGPV
jgi:pimeloyl-ACP methyl ester carboxylesterase